MLRLTIREILSRIEKEEIFSCVAQDGSFTLIIEDYVPYVCTAIHNGGNLRAGLREKIALNKADRWYEEDILTGKFISSLPIRIVANDSRYEYDLNRSLKEAIYDKAWGKKVWKKKLTLAEKELSYKKHKAFYKVVDKLLGKIISKFKACIVYDIHSFNYKRMDIPYIPLFNIGTVNVNKKFRPFIDDWKKRLRKIKSDYVEATVEENLVFQGKGNFLKHISKKHKDVLVLATEVKKSYCDEESGDIFPEIIADLKNGLKKAIIENAKFFTNKKANISVKKMHSLLSSGIDPIVRDIDEDLYSLLKDFDVLDYVNPKNIETEKRKFFSSKYKYVPEFKYNPIKFDISLIKRKLYDFPVDSITDITLQNIYRDFIDSYADQAELLSHRGDIKFLYASLKYFGEPDEHDLSISEFLLNCPNVDEGSSTENNLDTKAAAKIIQKEIDHYKFNGKIEFTSSMPSHAAFSPSRMALKLKKGMKFSKNFSEALGHHEVGVHMLTTENALLQPLKMFRVGLPVNTLTQEGLAIASEYYSGLLTISRLKELALRVVTVNHMVKYHDFNQTFSFLLHEHGVEENKAFYLTVRAYRGGGFTKDYLYLNGFKQIKLAVDSGVDLTNLLIGKTSLNYLASINELVTRKILKRPKYKTRALKRPSKKKNEILEYLLKAL